MLRQCAGPAGRQGDSKSAGSAQFGRVEHFDEVAPSLIGGAQRGDVSPESRPLPNTLHERPELLKEVYRGFVVVVAGIH
jgi:hypothetical protein